MAWNEPGKPGQDPWGNSGGDNRPNGSKKPSGSNQDPDLKELLKKAQDFLGGSNNQFGSGKNTWIGAVVLLIIWLLSGIYTVDSPERGVVKRFGAYAEETKAGLHWHLPWPIESVTIVNVDRIRTAEIGYRSDAQNRSGSVLSESLMLSR